LVEQHFSHKRQTVEQSCLAVGTNNIGTRLMKHRHERPPDATAGPGDEHGLSVKPEGGALRHSQSLPVDLILSLSKDEGVALHYPVRPTSWFDKLTMRSSRSHRFDCTFPDMPVVVTTGLVPVVHAIRRWRGSPRWIAGTSPAMTT